MLSHEVKEASRCAEGAEREKESFAKNVAEMTESRDADQRKMEKLAEEATRVKDKLSTAEKGLQEKTEKIKVGFCLDEFGLSVVFRMLLQ